MSGEIGGILLGGAVLVSALPIVLAGAAVIGAATGAASMGRAAAQAHREAEERRRREALEIRRCGAEVSETYSRLQSVLERQEAKNGACYSALESQMNRFSADLRKAAAEGGDSKRLAESLRKAREDAAKTLNSIRTQELARIRRETERETASIMSALEQAQRARMDAADWNSRTAAAQAGQNAMARDFLRDAEASANLLRTLAASSGDPDFQAKADVIARSYQRAAALLEAGNAQASSAQAQQIITESASMITAHELERADKEALRIALESRLEGLRAELEAQGRVVFTDDLYGEEEEFLDDFTQGEYSRVLQRVRDALSEIRGDAGRNYTAYKLQSLLDDVEDNMIPQAEEVLRVGYEKLTHYYERLHALQIVGNYMKEQGYSMEWAQSVGDDATQKLVVHFREPGSGNTIAVSLDEQADAEDIGRMAMEVMFYYANGRPVSEAEKKAVREGMMGALREAGLSGGLQCTGCVNQEASDKTMDSAEALQNLPVNRIFPERQAQL